MPDFSVILQNAEVRAVVQENLLERAFHDALFPYMLFRGEVSPVVWPAGVGDSQIFSAPGLMPVSCQPTRPGEDPAPQTYPLEQWTAQLNQYTGSVDTHMPTSMVAIANLFMRNAHQLGMQAGQTLNRCTRNRMYAAALAGWTVADGAQAATTSLRVKRLNGFTRARNPALSGTQAVRFELVSPGNPLAVLIFDNAAQVANTVVGYIPDTPGDEQGPGVLTLSAAVTSVADRGYVISVDRSDLVRVGGGLKVDDVGTSDVPTLADVRSAVSKFWQDNVPAHPDGRFHAHLDPKSQAQIFADAEFQRLMQSLPDYYPYKEFALGELLGTVFLRNSECPVAQTVVGGTTATFSQDDPFVGELFANGNPSTGVPVHEILFTAQGGILEYYNDMSGLISEAGIAGKIAEPSITNSGIEVMTDRIQLIIRQPMNRLADMVSTSWRFMGDWPMRTDAATGGPARFKRMRVIQHGE
jgi:hypothetical protein